MLLKSLITDDVTVILVTALLERVAKLGFEAYDTRHTRAGPPNTQWVLVMAEKQRL